MNRTIFKDSVAYSPPYLINLLVDEKLILYIYLILHSYEFFAARTQLGNLQCHYFTQIIYIQNKSSTTANSKVHKTLMIRISETVTMMSWRQTILFGLLLFGFLSHYFFVLFIQQNIKQKNFIAVVSCGAFWNKIFPK